MELNFNLGDKVTRGQKLIVFSKDGILQKQHETKSNFLKKQEEYEELLHWNTGSDVQKTRQSVSNAEQQLKTAEAKLKDDYLVHPEKWLPAISSSIANKILNVNTLIYLYFIDLHDVFASWWHFHVPLLETKNASSPVFLVEILRGFEANTPFLKHIYAFFRTSYIKFYLINLYTLAVSKIAYGYNH